MSVSPLHAGPPADAKHLASEQPSHSLTHRQALCPLGFYVCGFSSNQGWAGRVTVHPRPRPGSLCTFGCRPLALMGSLVDVCPTTVGSVIAHPVAVPGLPQVEVTHLRNHAWPQRPELVPLAELWKWSPPPGHFGLGNARPRGQVGRLHPCHHPEGLGFTTPPPGRRQVGGWGCGAGEGSRSYLTMSHA